MATMFCVPPPPGKEEFERRFRVRLLWQGYGMTEIYPLPMRMEMLDAPPDTIGYPVTWMEYGVVDDRDNLLGPGEPGQLVFRPLIPNAMARGYYKDPEATTQAFRNFMFHTGDLAVYDEDGCLHYRGRIQERIRRRGENISALELELVALKHPDVLEAAAYGVPGEFGEDDVKLDVVVKDAVELAELREWLVGMLPRFMVPRYLEVRDAFPKTPSERVEKYKLADQPLDRPGVHDSEADRVPR
jgi:crotonobetaine/carnitine-CoA ligase